MSKINIGKSTYPAAHYQKRIEQLHGDDLLEEKLKFNALGKPTEGTKTEHILNRQILAARLIQEFPDGWQKAMAHYHTRKSSQDKSTSNDPYDLSK